MGFGFINRRLNPVVGAVLRSRPGGAPDRRRAPNGTGHAIEPEGDVRVEIQFEADRVRSS